MTSKSQRACVFCGGGPLSAEHNPPQWVNSFLPPAIRATNYYETPAGRVARASGKTMTLKTVRAVCKSCNNNWMSDLEDTIRPFVGPMILGRGTPLVIDQQLQLATWLFKNFLMDVAAGNREHQQLLQPLYHELYC